ncbi:MAG: hypothetical protein SH817_14460 [Leptospira sp.]|nr:hypothetical protein [Leptospira sp.]
MKNKGIYLLILLAIFSGTNCKKEKSDDKGLFLGLLLLANQLNVNTAQSLANESNDDYTKNEWGLIEGSKLESFVSDWTTNRPSHITGNLIILQTDSANRITGDTKRPFIAENPMAYL